MRVFENRVLWRLFGPKKDKVTGSCRKLHNEELHQLGGAHNNHEGDEKCIQNFGWKAWREETTQKT
jgi:hypothetical protein